MSVTINCPKCSAGLKLPDRSLLGRKGKCPNCQHRFVLEEPDEVQLQLADPPSPAPVPATPNDPMMGTSAKWVPDGPVSAAAAPAAPAPPAENPFDFTAPASSAPGGPPDLSTSAGPTLPASDSGSVVNRVRRKKKSRTGPIAIGVGTALFVFCMLGLWWQQKTESEQKRLALPRQQKPKPTTHGKLTLLIRRPQMRLRKRSVRRTVRTFPSTTCRLHPI